MIFKQWHHWSRTTILLLAAVVAQASAKEPVLSSSEILLRLAEAPYWLENSPEQLLQQLEPALHSSQNDSITWEIQWWLLRSWNRLPRSEKLDKEAEEWFNSLAQSPWNQSKHIEELAKWSRFFYQEPSSIRERAPADSVGEALQQLGSSVWIKQEGVYKPLLPDEKMSTLPEGSIIKRAEDGWVVSRHPLRSLTYQWQWGEQSIDENSLPEEASWVIVLDDGRLVSAGETWLLVQRGAQTLLHVPLNGLGACSPAVDPLYSWNLILDCPGGERQLIDLTSGAPLVADQFDRPSLKQIYTQMGMLRLTSDGIELRTSPEGRLLWRHVVVDPRDMALFNNRLFVRSGEETLLVFDLRSRKLVNWRKGVSGLFVSSKRQIATYTPQGMITFLRRDGSIKSIYHAGKAVQQPPVEEGETLHVLLENDQLISLRTTIDEAVVQTQNHFLFKEWESQRDTSILYTVLRDEPGAPWAWRALAQAVFQSQPTSDSVIAYWERGLRGKLFFSNRDQEIDQWRSAWGVRWIQSIPGEPPFRPKLFLFDDLLCSIGDRNNSLLFFDLKKRTFETKPHLPSRVIQAMTIASSLFATTQDHRLFRINPGNHLVDAEWKSLENLLMATPGNLTLLLLSVTEDSLVLRSFNEDLHSSIVQKIKREPSLPTQITANQRYWAMGYPQGKIRGGIHSSTEKGDWEVSLGQDLTQMIHIGDTLIVGTTKSRLHLLEMKSGKLLGRLDAPSGEAGAPIFITGNGAYIVAQFENGMFVSFRRGGVKTAHQTHEHLDWKICWAHPIWWKRSLIVPQPDGVWLVSPEEFQRKRLAFLPSPPSSCLIAKEELACQYSPASDRPFFTHFCRSRRRKSLINRRVSLKCAI